MVTLAASLRSRVVVVLCTTFAKAFPPCFWADGGAADFPVRHDRDDLEGGSLGGKWCTSPLDPIASFREAAGAREGQSGGVS